ncbi:MAG: site-2 protease family protein [Bryobacterales bacterium]|nr:site-2 protease family protein [Bryobacterales bacterium]
MGPQPTHEQNPQSGSVGRVQIFGIPIRFHFTFVLLVVFLLVLGFGGEQSGAAIAIYVLALFGSVLLHELGHALVSRRFGIKTTEIVLYPIGGVSRPERKPTPTEELWISLAGPVVNLVIAGLLLAYLYFTHGLVAPAQMLKPTDNNLMERIAAGNLILALFNLLPAFPMDGGRVLRALLARHRGEDEATRIAAATGQSLAFLIGLYGLLSAQFLLVFIAFFVYIGAAQEGAAAVSHSLTSGYPVRAAMVTEFHTLTHGQTLRDAANLLLATTQKDFPVALGSQVLGLLDRNRLFRAMATASQDTLVASMMDRNFLRVSPAASLSETLPLLVDAGGCALVMEDDRLVGLLSTDNISEFLLLRKFGISVQSVEPSAAG